MGCVKPPVLWGFFRNGFFGGIKPVDFEVPLFRALAEESSAEAFVLTRTTNKQGEIRSLQCLKRYGRGVAWVEIFATDS